MVTPVTTPKKRPDLIKLTDELEILMYEPTEDQAVVITKALKAAQRSPEAGPAAIDIVFRVITRLLADPLDADRIDTALIEGDLKVRVLASKALRYDEEDENDKPAPNRRARRARQ